jgi:hypothetical protein
MIAPEPGRKISDSPKVNGIEKFYSDASGLKSPRRFGIQKVGATDRIADHPDLHALSAFPFQHLGEPRTDLIHAEDILFNLDAFPRRNTVGIHGLPCIRAPQIELPRRIRH